MFAEAGNANICDKSRWRNNGWCVRCRTRYFWSRGLWFTSRHFFQNYVILRSTTQLRYGRRAFSLGNDRYEVSDQEKEFTIKTLSNRLVLEFVTEQRSKTFPLLCTTALNNKQHSYVWAWLSFAREFRSCLLCQVTVFLQSVSQHDNFGNALQSIGHETWGKEAQHSIMWWRFKLSWTASKPVWHGIFEAFFLDHEKKMNNIINFKPYWLIQFDRVQHE